MHDGAHTPGRSKNGGRCVEVCGIVPLRQLSLPKHRTLGCWKEEREKSTGTARRGRGPGGGPDTGSGEVGQEVEKP